MPRFVTRRRAVTDDDDDDDDESTDSTRLDSRRVGGCFLITEVTEPVRCLCARAIDRRARRMSAYGRGEAILARRTVAEPAMTSSRRSRLTSSPEPTKTSMRAPRPSGDRDPTFREARERARARAARRGE